MLSLAERQHPEIAEYQKLVQQLLALVNVSRPGIIQAYNASDQTVNVQIAVRDTVQILEASDGSDPVYNQNNVELQILPHIPFTIVSGGGYSITATPQLGDECLLIFSDISIDGWRQSGGVQNRLHPFRRLPIDCFALLGIKSTPNALSGVSQSSVQIRSDDGSTYAELAGGQFSTNGNLQSTGAASGTLTDRLGNIVTLQNGVIQNAGTGINLDYFNRVLATINAANTILDLQRFVDQAFNSFQPVTAQISIQITSLGALNVVPTDLADCISWITNEVGYIAATISNLTAQLALLTAQMTALVTAATNRATNLGGSITIPPI